MKVCNILEIQFLTHTIDQHTAVKKKRVTLMVQTQRALSALCVCGETIFLSIAFISTQLSDKVYSFD